MKLKTHKAFSKRFKVTKTGKVMKRRAGQDHFNGRDTGKISRKKRRDQELDTTNARAVATLIPYQE